MHEELYAMAGSNQCQLADPPHVEAISACGNSFQCKRVDTLSAQKLKYFDRIASFLVVRVLQQVTELYTAMTCTIWMLHIRDFSGQGPGLLARWLGRQVKSSQVNSSQVKSKPGRRVAGPFRAQAVNQKRQYLQIRIYKSLHFRPCKSCRKSQKVPTMFFCPVRIPSNAQFGCDLLIPSVPWPT